MGYGETKKKKRKDRENDDGIFGMLRAVFIGVGVSVGAALVLWIGATALAYAQSDPDAIMPILAFCAIYAAAFLGGIAAGKIDRDRGLICGALCGVIITFLLLFVSIFAKSVYSSGYNFFGALLLRAAVVVVCSLGGMVGSHKRQKKRYGKR